ncbi:glutamate receptor-like [Eriocheir sinensis]|uniref:glutamate receptor-like n=1 Tax=Eriocheir sinensis TaxID=95602 RepID=UPI0021C6BCEB|nr:glutamate receptor-like [Eriocheir sinensis]
MVAAAEATLALHLRLGFLLLAVNTLAASKGQLKVLSEVLSGPVRGRPLALHLDASLSADERRAVVGVEAVRRTPHLTLTHDFNYSRRLAAPPGDFFISSKVLHVVLWLTPRPELLQELWLNWKPHNLLLFSLGLSPGTDLLRHEAFSGVENVALIGHLMAQEDLRPDALGVYTVLPFSPGGVRLVGPWRREAFASWEALFPDRFPSFEGYTFHIASWMQDEPFLYQNELNPQNGEGVFAELLKVLSVKLNFTYTATTVSTDCNWGALSNGSWNGLMGMVERGEKNFTINQLFLTYERGRDFDFSSSLQVFGFGAFLRRPAPLPLWTSLWRPLQPAVWAAVLACLVTVILLAKIKVGTFR